MSRRLRLIVWAAIAVLIWNVIFDLHITRGVRYVLQATAEAELGWGPSVAIGDVMRTTSRDGAKAASLWAAMVFVAGWLTTRR
ncbi:MAG: hypothetical protein DIU54_012115 [Acidobacteriota bacterium]|jgi:hypothetical protein|nr:MAG: hypothetical protein DIU54_00085 [Acidobacteriota bacterium]